MRFAQIAPAGTPESSPETAKLPRVYGLFTTLMAMFLPTGFPDTVSSDYLNYQIWDSLQAFFSTINGLLTTQAMLTSMGVGRAEATASGALITWVLQDGIAMVGRILFSWQYAPSLDRNVKTWRLAADYFNDLGMLLCLISPAFKSPQLNLLSMCIGSLFKALCGVCGAATKGSLTVHFAKANNLADVSAKDGSQETIVNLCGMLSGTFLVTAIDGITLYITEGLEIPLAWLLFTLFTGMHLFCNYRAVKSVILDTLNDQRYELLCRHYFFTNGNDCLSPQNVAEGHEKIFWWHLMPGRPRIILGAPLTCLSPISVDQTADGYVFTITDNAIYIGLLRDFSRIERENSAILLALFHAHQITNRPGRNRLNNKLFSSFIGDLRHKGWSLDNFQFSDRGYRLSLAAKDE